MAVDGQQADGETPEDDGDDDWQVRPVYPKRGPNREGMVNEYLPSEHDWVAKTNLDLHDPARVAALAHFDEYYPEIAELQDTIDSFLLQFLKGRTSISAAARDEYTDILMAMFGVDRDEKNFRNRITAALVGDDLNED